MRLTQIFKHYHSCPETVLVFIFFIEWMTCLPKWITRFFGSVFYVRSSRKSSFVLILNYHTNLALNSWTQNRRKSQILNPPKVSRLKHEFQARYLIMVIIFNCALVLFISERKNCTCSLRLVSTLTLTLTLKQHSLIYSPLNRP